MTSTGEMLTRARENAGLSQAQLAQSSGVHQPSISAYERGRAQPRPETLGRLLAATRTRPSLVLERRRDEILAAAARRRVTRVRVFGSAVHGRDTPGSDIDLLVTFEPGATIFDLAGFADDSEEILGSPVDIVTEDTLSGPIGERILAEAVSL